MAGGVVRLVVQAEEEVVVGSSRGGGGGGGGGDVDGSSMAMVPDAREPASEVGGVFCAAPGLLRKASCSLSGNASRRRYSFCMRSVLDIAITRVCWSKYGGVTGRDQQLRNFEVPVLGLNRCMLGWGSIHPS